jgi:DedD protein
VDDINLKQRLVGAVVLVSLAVIFIPLILDGRDPSVNYITKSNIPPKPERDFVSRVIPLNPSPVPQPEVLEPEVIAEPVEAAPVVEEKAEKAAQPADAVKPASKAPAKAKTATKPVVTEPAPKVIAKPKLVAKPKTGLSAWAVQVGSFGSKKNAYALRDKLRKQGFNAFVDTLYNKDTPTFRVRVGPEIKLERAEALQAKLAKVLKAKPIVVKHP